MKFYKTMAMTAAKIRNAITGNGQPITTMSAWRDFAGLSPTASDLSEVTYFTCLKALSESIGKMPVYLMDADKNRVREHETNRILSIQPNDTTTPIKFFTYLEYCRNHYGNAYAYIQRDVRGNLEGLYALDPLAVQIWLNNTDIFSSRRYYYYYTDAPTGESYWINPDDMIHVTSWTTEQNGLAGKSVREILASNMTGNKAAQEFLNNLYQNGLTANAVVKNVGCDFFEVHFSSAFSLRSCDRLMDISHKIYNSRRR